MTLHKEDPAADRSHFWGWPPERSHFVGDICMATTHWHTQTFCKNHKAQWWALAQPERLYAEIDSFCSLHHRILARPYHTHYVHSTPPHSQQKRIFLRAFGHSGNKFSPEILGVRTFGDNGTLFRHPSLLRVFTSAHLWDSICHFLPSKSTWFNLITACHTVPSLSSKKKQEQVFICGITRTLWK